MIGGTFFRLGTGAMAFLFPLMLQLTFGLTPFESGSVTFAGAVGAFAAKFFTERILNRFGFRPMLVLSSLVTLAGVFAMGLYTPGTPMWFIIAILVATGFFQSIFWTTTNAFVFADVEDKDAGQANVISQVGIHLSIAFSRGAGRRRARGDARRRTAASRCSSTSTSRSTC